MNTAREEATATLLNNGEVLIVGGNGSSGVLASAEIYNPATGTFAYTNGSLNTARCNHTATLMGNGMVLITGGLNSSGTALASAELYNPGTGTFTLTGNMSYARYDHTATLLDSGLILIADSQPLLLDPGELYTPGTGTFTVAGDMLYQHSGQPASLLDSGMILIAGNNEFRSTSTSSELYNPATGDFASTGSLNTTRGGNTATVLNNGTVLVAGGVNYTDSHGVWHTNTLASSEIYDPQAGGFSNSGNLNTARASHTATLIENGEVLVIGGTPGPFLGSAELYEPTSLTPPGLQSVTITPGSPWIPISGTENLVATGTFTGNGTETLVSAVWSSSNTAAGNVTNDSTNRGHVYGVAAGTATVTACAGSVCGSTTVTVNEHTNLIVGSQVGDGASCTDEGLTDSGASIGPVVNLDLCFSSHSATKLQNGTIFVAGGAQNSTSWEVLSPVGQKISESNNQTVLESQFYGHVAVLLQNGNIFLAGGTPSPSTWEIHDSSGNFVGTGSLFGKRRPGAGAVLLPNGNVWISGDAAGVAGKSDECDWEIHDQNGNLVADGNFMIDCYASGKVLLLSNGNVVVIGGKNDPMAYEVWTETGSFVTNGTITDTFDNQGGAVLAGNNIFLFEEGYWEYIGFGANSSLVFDTPGTTSLYDSRLGARGVLTSTGDFLITGGSAAPSTWEIWAPNGTTANFVSQGQLQNTHYPGHSDTHF